MMNTLTQLTSNNYMSGLLLDKFNKMVELETDECILWEYGKADGYGQLSHNKVRDKVHRMALVRRVGNQPLDKPYALHSCRNRNCFNYRHLRWGNQKENCADKIKDGTNYTPYGEKHYNSKLKEEQINEILKDNRVHRIIAKDYNVSRSTIGKIKTHKNWAWITPPLSMEDRDEN